MRDRLSCDDARRTSMEVRDQVCFKPGSSHRFHDWFASLKAFCVDAKHSVVNWIPPQHPADHRHYAF